MKLKQDGLVIMKSKMLCASLVLFSSLGMAEINTEQLDIEDSVSAICEATQKEETCKPFLLSLLNITLRLGSASMACEIQKNSLNEESKIDCEKIIKLKKRYERLFSN
jgi:hypothetical protein